MEQLPEQQQVQLGAPGLHNLGHGLRQAAVHLPTKTHQHHLPSDALLRRNSADAPAMQGARGADGSAVFGGSHSWGASAPHPAGSGGSGSSLLNRGLLHRQPQSQQQQQQQVAVADAVAAAAAAAARAAAGGVPTRGISRAHSGSNNANNGIGATAGGVDGSGAPAAAGFGSVVEVDTLKQPLLSACDDEDSSEDA